MNPTNPQSAVNRQLLLAMRAASARIEELSRRNQAYEAVIQDFEHKLKVAKWTSNQLRFWPWVALATALVALLLQRLSL